MTVTDSKALAPPVDSIDVSSTATVEMGVNPGLARINSYTITVQTVPEPRTLALFVSALLGMMVVYRQSKLVRTKK
jgi:hypothetical protein